VLSGAAAGHARRCCMHWSPLGAGGARAAAWQSDAATHSLMRHCLHCEAAGQPDLAEDTHHMIFSCVLYDSLRVAHPSLFPPGEEPTLVSFLADPTATHASFAGAIRRRGRAASGLPP
jgi:hypothetical protein